VRSPSPPPACRAGHRSAGPGRARGARLGAVLLLGLHSGLLLAACDGGASGNAKGGSAPRTGPGPAPDAVVLAGIERLGTDAMSEGAVLLTSLGARRADLVRPDGRLLHRWHEPEGLRWQAAVLLEGGDLAVVSIVQKKRGNHTYVARFDADGGERWRTQVNAQHDLELQPGGGLLLLTRGSKRVFGEDASRRIRDNHVTQLSLSGELGSWQSIYGMLADDQRFVWHEPPAPLAGDDEGDEEDVEQDAGAPTAGDASAAAGAGGDADDAQDAAVERPPALDLLHATSVSPVPDATPFGCGTAGEPLLITLRNQARVVLVDRASQRLLWVGGDGVLEQPVDATCSGSRVYVLDGGREGGAARVLALALPGGELVWEYAASPRESFSTPAQGELQCLPDGHLLVSATDQGEAFELTPAGEVVWRCRNTDLNDQGRPAALRATWIAPALLGPFESRR